MAFDVAQFAEKYRLALETARSNQPHSGVCGYEIEWNLLDSHFRPLLTVGSGPGQQSFVDYLRACCIPPGIRDYSQLEVFHWMIEWATRPYYRPLGAVFEARLMEAVLINALHKVSREFGEQLYCWHGNLLFSTDVGHHTIPGSWQVAKRRYLERCVDLYGDALATAGMHTNLSLPEPLLAWDFMHLPGSDWSNGHLEDYQNMVYITATRLMRAFTALFISSTASTPFQAQIRDGRPEVILTEYDSVRNLTFPNPAALDLPDLYRSHTDYLAISTELVRNGLRFGNNNWTPVRARSFAEPVERLIEITSDQLEDLYARGLYAIGESPSVEEMARRIEIENLLARIRLPMSRVEVRTDDGGHSLDLDVANLTFKHLLLVRFYADPEFGRAFRYDREDLSRAQRNELEAARMGLRAVIENPFTGKSIQMRQFLRWTLDELRPLAEAVGVWEDLQPLVEMASGSPNTAESLRARLRKELGDCGTIPLEIFQILVEERKDQVNRDLEFIVSNLGLLDDEANKLGDFLQRARDDIRLDPDAPLRFQPSSTALREVSYPDTTTEIVDLASQLIRIPSVSVGVPERPEDIHRVATFVYDFVRLRGLEVELFNQGKYPAMVVGFPGGLKAPVMFCGHYDVVAPDPDDSQFTPRLDGDYLWGRGAADMKTVVATYLIWMKDRLRHGPPYPPINLLLVGNEETGEGEPMGTSYVLQALAEDGGYQPGILIAGERTEEGGTDLWGDICTQNRGVLRFHVVGHGLRTHSAMAEARTDLTERLSRARVGLERVIHRRLTLKSPDGWVSQTRFPFIQVGTPGVYNITADFGILGVEVRPIPQDDINTLVDELEAYCLAEDLEIRDLVVESGIACDEENPYLVALASAVQRASGREPRYGRKLAGTSARFAPGGQGLVWGQSGIGPHTREERHYVPSIEPYYRALEAYASVLNQAGSDDGSA